MSMRTPANCQLKIDGRATEAVISPYIGQHGFWLWNDALGARAHFSLAPRPASLHEILRQRAGGAFAIELLDKDLGQVDEYRGYAAVDMGPYTRRVTSLTLGLAHRDGVSKFQLAGIAGPVDPGSIFQGAGTAHTRSQYQFEVEFDIADEALHFYVVDGVALPAIQRYIKSVD